MACYHWLGLGKQYFCVSTLSGRAHACEHFSEALFSDWLWSDAIVQNQYDEFKVV